MNGPPSERAARQGDPQFADQQQATTIADHTAARQAERLHERFGISYPVALVVASLAYARCAR